MKYDDYAKVEEDRINRAMNRKRNSVVLPKGADFVTSSPTSPPKGSFPVRQSSVNVINKSPFERPKPVTQPKSILASTASPVTSPHRVNQEIESLQIKKRSILGAITTGRRELDEVRNEIAKLKSKEAELVAVLEKRDQAVQQLNQDIEALEQKDQNEELKRKEEEKARRIKEEIEKRRREEELEERKKLEEEEEREKEKEREREREKERERPTPKPVYAPQFQDDEDENAEEIRLMRAMSRPGKGNVNVTSRVVSPPQSKPSKPQISEAEKIRMAEEKKKFEEEQRLAQERQLQERVAHLQQVGGVSKTFVSGTIYDFDAEVKFYADFTNWEEIPITTSMDKNFTYSITWKVSPGVHFYLFKINGKIEINKNVPTGLAPNGQLMNKVDCS